MSTSVESVFLHFEHIFCGMLNKVEFWVPNYMGDYSSWVYFYTIQLGLLLKDQIHVIYGLTEWV